jgi:hypothetical protein
VLSIVKSESRHHGPWAKGRGNAVIRRKHVEPKNTSRDHFFDQQDWEALERNGIEHAPSAFLDSPNEAFDLGYVFSVGTHVETRPRLRELPTEHLKLAVSMRHVYQEPAGTVEAHNIKETFCDSVFLSVRQEFDRGKLDIA